MKLYQTNDENRDLLLSSAEFEEMPTPSTYDSYGQSITPENAGAYVQPAEGKESEFYAELKAICEAEGEDFTKEESYQAYDNWSIYELVVTKMSNDLYLQGEDTVTAYNYHDGSNFRTVTLVDDFGNNDVDLIDDEEAAQIIEAWENAEFYQESNGFKVYKGGGYIFHRSLWASDWWTAQVVKEELGK